MGSGTEVAKEAGDIVILDDNFLSIKQAILYGRTIYNSICKFIVFQLTINFSAVAINFIAPFIGIDKPAHHYADPLDQPGHGYSGGTGLRW